MVMKRRGGSVVVMLIAAAALAACAFPGSRQQSEDADPRGQYVGSWIASTDGATSTLVLAEDGTFEVRDFPRSLACDPASADVEQLDLCGQGTAITTSGTWTSYRDDPTKVWLKTEGQTLAVGYKDLDSFFGHSFSIGFYTGSIDKPEPDYRFRRDDDR